MCNRIWISWIAAFQVLILEPSKVLQPAIVCVSEEDESRTVQLKHVTPLKVCWSLYPPPQPPSYLMMFLSTRHSHRMQNELRNTHIYTLIYCSVNV